MERAHGAGLEHGKELGLSQRTLGNVVVSACRTQRMESTGKTVYCDFEIPLGMESWFTLARLGDPGCNGQTWEDGGGLQSNLRGGKDGWRGPWHFCGVRRTAVDTTLVV